MARAVPIRPMFQPKPPSGLFSGATIIPAAMLMDWPTIWATARIISMIQARCIPLGVWVVTGVGVVETAMMFVILRGYASLFISF